MSGDKLNTAEFDSKGRCVRHPAIRLRKKKLLGGWKVLIGHCPECCLDEMRRVRDEIDGHDDDDHDHHHHHHRGDAKKTKKSSKKSSSGRAKGQGHSSSKKRTSKNYQRGGSDEHSGIESEGYDPRVDASHRTSASYRRHGKGDGESEATGSTSQMTDSVSGSGSVVSEQYVPRNHNFGGPGYFPPPVQAPPGHPSQLPQGGERTMVLSMAYLDPQTGQRGTYTGQVDSATHKPDGKGTLYYSNGSIAEGTWSHGVLVVEGDDDYRGGAPSGRHSVSHGRQEHNRNDFRRSDSRSRSGHRQEPTAMMGHPSHNGGGRTSMGGNLDKLELLGGPRHRPRGASASVQSYNSRSSRGSHFGSQSMAGGGGAGGSVFHGGLESTGYYDDRGRVRGGRYNRDP